MGPLNNDTELQVDTSKIKKETMIKILNISELHNRH